MRADYEHFNHKLYTNREARRKNKKTKKYKISTGKLCNVIKEESK